MARDFFDVKQLRRNFDRLGASGERPAVSRLDDVLVPLDPFVVGRELVAKVRTEALSWHPDHAAALVPLIERAEGLIERLARAVGPQEVDDAAKDDGAAAALRLELVATLEKIDDLCLVLGALWK